MVVCDRCGNKIDKRDSVHITIYKQSAAYSGRL